MRKIRRKNKQKRIIIISTLSLLLFLCIGYAAFSTNLTLTAKGNVKEKSRVIQSWEAESQENFHSIYYKENIVSITFLDNNNVPSNKIESWNVSEDKENGGVLAWVTPNNQDNSKYDLYIGAKGGVIANIDSSYLFYDFQNVKEINFNNNFDTSNAVKMTGMFYLCLNVETLDLSNFDTSNVVNMANMFNLFNPDGYIMENKLKTIIFGDKFTTKNVTTFSQMFTGCTNLTSLDIANWDTSNVTTMASTFALCRSLQNLDISNWDTSKVTKMSNMFQSCRSLKNLDLSKWDTSNVEDMSIMFQDTNFIDLNLCNFNTSSVKNFMGMFAYTSNLKHVYVKDNFITKGANTNAMFLNSNISSVTYGQC